MLDSAKLRVLLHVYLLLVDGLVLTDQKPVIDCKDRRPCFRNDGTFDQCFHPNVELCCNGDVHANDGTKRCCGNTVHTYFPSSQICCGDKVSPRNESISETCCNGRIIAEEKYQCCGDSVQSKAKVCCAGRAFDPKEGWDCCGNQYYNKVGGQVCDFETFTVHNGKFEFFCAGIGYDRAKQSCCDGTLNSMPEVDSDGREVNPGCCSGVSYRSDTQMCCNKTVHEKAKNRYCCGNGTFDADIEECCGGKTYSKVTSVNYGCCGGTRYRIGNGTCCSKVLNTTVKDGDCGTVETSAGFKEVAYDPSMYKYCPAERKIVTIGDCCKNEHTSRCCGGMSYNSTVYRCISRGRRLVLDMRTDLEICGNDYYDPQSGKRCCSTDIHDPQDTICCRGYLYDIPTNKAVCFGYTPYLKKDLGECGGQYYIPERQFCCGNKTRRQTILWRWDSTRTCKNGTVYKKCGGEWFNPKTHRCHKKMIVGKRCKNFRCVPVENEDNSLVSKRKITVVGVIKDVKDCKIHVTDIVRRENIKGEAFVKWEGRDLTFSMGKCCKLCFKLRTGGELIIQLKGRHLPSRIKEGNCIKLRRKDELIEVSPSRLQSLGLKKV